MPDRLAPVGCGLINAGILALFRLADDVLVAVPIACAAVLEKREKILSATYGRYFN